MNEADYLSYYKKHATKKGRGFMLKKFIFILAPIIVIIGFYELITSNFELQSVMMLLISLLMLVMGLEEFQKNSKLLGWVFIVVFLFALFVSIQGFLLN